MGFSPLSTGLSTGFYVTRSLYISGFSGYIISVKKKNQVDFHKSAFAGNHSPGINREHRKGVCCPVEHDTIAAIATGLPGAIGIVRLSGPRAVELAATLFRAADGRPLADHPPRTTVFGRLCDETGQVIDHVLCTYSRGPSSYTGEDTAELHCHGAPLVLQLTLDALFALGGRQAQPGEYTKRAFLNGRLDLAQAEAVVDLIDAQTREGVLQSAGQLGGALSRRVDGVYNLLVDLLAHFHAVLDYPDEDIDPFRTHDMLNAFDRAQEELEQLLSTHRRGQALVSGVPCAVVGRPNAGKSSLLNALLGYERAIVTDVPGTTRDTVEERLRLGGTLLRLIDTAGLRQSSDPVERLGVQRSKMAMEQAALILYLHDHTLPFTPEDGQLLADAVAHAPTILVWNKCDLPAASAPDFPIPADIPVVELSAKTGRGLDRLEQAVALLLPREENDACGELLTNARQADAARRALESVILARRGLEQGYTPDAVLVDVESALSALGELTGRTVREDVTARIFQRFCVGK